MYSGGVLAANLLRAGGAEPASRVGRIVTEVEGRTGSSPYTVSVDISSLSPQENDLAVVYLGTGSSGKANIGMAAGSGYTRYCYAFADASVDSNSYVFFKLLGDGETTVPVNTGISSSPGIAVIIELIRGADLAQPIATSPNPTAANRRISYPIDIDPAAAGSLVSVYHTNSEAVPVDSGYDNFATLATTGSFASLNMYHGTGQLDYAGVPLDLPQIGPAVEGSGDTSIAIPIAVRPAGSGLPAFNFAPFVSSGTFPQTSTYRNAETSTFSSFEASEGEVDDLLLWAVFANNNVGGTVGLTLTPPAGWTSCGTPVNAGGMFIEVFWKRSTGSAAFQAMSYTNTETLLMNSRKFCVKGVPTTGTPFEAYSTSSGTGTALAGADVTTLGDRRKVISLSVWQAQVSAARDDANVWNPHLDYTDPTGWDIAYAIGSKEQEEIGTLTGEAITLGASYRWANVSLAALPQT